MNLYLGICIGDLEPMIVDVTALTVVAIAGGVILLAMRSIRRRKARGLMAVRA